MTQPQDPGQRIGHYERLGVVPLAPVLEAIREPGQRRVFLGQMVAVGGLRMATFARQDGPCCSNPECGLHATHFAVERPWSDDPVKRERGSWHLNLYGHNTHGHEVLFTHDHTLARALGGKNDPQNTTTMCLRCNARKSVLEHQLVKARRLALGLPANHSRRGAPSAQSPNPDSRRRALEKGQSHLAWLAGQRGLDEAQYRAVCEHEGQAYAQRKPMRRFVARHAWLAVGLGLSRDGYRFLRHDHNEQQKALRSPQRRGPGMG